MARTAREALLDAEHAVICATDRESELSLERCVSQIDIAMESLQHARFVLRTRQTQGAVTNPTTPPTVDSTGTQVTRDVAAA